MKDSKQLYKKLSEDFKTEKYYSFANRGEDMLQAREKNGKRVYLVNKEREEAWELINALGTFSLWNASAVEISSLFDMTGKVLHTALSVKAPYYFGVEDYANGVTMVVWTLQPDGCYYADSDGYGMTDDDEINVYAYIDREGHILVPFQPMDHDLKECYREMAEKIAVNREKIPYVCLSSELTIPFEENHNLRNHEDVLYRVIFGMMQQMSAMALNKDDDREYDGSFSVLTAINPSVDRHLDYVLFAKETEEGSGRYEMISLTILYEEGKEPVGCRNDFGDYNIPELSEILENKESVQLFIDDFVESAEMVLSGNLPQQD